MSTKNERLTKQEQNIEWRRDKVQELSSKGYSQREISTALQVSLGTINADIQYLRERAKENIHHYITTTLPEEMENSLVRTNNMIKELHKDIDNPDASIKDKQNAIALINQCTQLRLEILGSGALTSELSSRKTHEEIGAAYEIKAIPRTT